MTLAIDRSSSTRSLIADDPLIAGMSIRQSLPLHESSTRLRELYPECPRAYGVAVMSDVGRRRWWPLARALNTDRLEQMYARAVEETGSDSIAVHQLADALVHTVVGRLVALVVLEGRAWDPGLGNLWVYFDSEGCIDWAGVVDPTLRVLPDDPDRDRQQVVVFPGEDASPRGPRTDATERSRRCSPACRTSARARWKSARCGSWSARRWWVRRPMCRCSRGPVKPTECAVGRPSWTGS